jgi:exodeoxyribonuclease-3
MKLMSYNILNGGESGIEKIYEIIESEAPDFLTINEANTFKGNGNQIPENIKRIGNFKVWHLALSIEADYHVAVFSKYKWESVLEVKSLARACILTEIKTDAGTVSIGGLHLAPYNEDIRIAEIEKIFQAQKKFRHKILMGDFNSLSENDHYNPLMIKDFNEMQLNKFTTGGKFRFDTIAKLKQQDFIDAGELTGQNSDHTAPTAINECSAHTNMRLDYFMVSKDISTKINKYHVIKNDLTETASDHYPIVMEIKGVNSFFQIDKATTSKIIAKGKTKK